MDMPKLSPQVPTDDAEAAERARQVALMTEFPVGLAPFTRGSLQAFGFWGGILAAGFAGAVNQRRAGQSALPPLLTGVVLLLVFWGVGYVLVDRFNGIAYLNLILPIGNSISGIIFATWIAGRQRVMLNRWTELAGKADRDAQGGCLNAIGWIGASTAVAYVLYAVYATVGLPLVFQIAYPPQQFTQAEIGVWSLPGWGTANPESIEIDCDSGDYDCLVMLADRWTGSTAIFLLVKREAFVTPESFAEAVAFGIKSRNYEIDQPEPVVLQGDYLNGHEAYSFAVNIGDVKSVFTSIDAGDTFVSFTLNCGNGLQTSCERLRDQYIQSMTFPADA